MKEIVLTANKDLLSDHPSFLDPEYRKRREQIVSITKTFHQHSVLEYDNNFPEIIYQSSEIQTWQTVYQKLTTIFPLVACKEYLIGLEQLQEQNIFRPDQIPDLKSVSDYLFQQTGFKLYPVSGLLTPRQFLNALANKTFCCTQYIRHSSRPFYTPEPDIIHEMFGHVPLFLDPTICEISHMIGKRSLSCSDEEIVKLERIYWFTLEFGLLLESGVTKIYGAGILSSVAEIENIQNHDHLIFDWQQVIHDNPLITEMQKHYYIIHSLDDLKNRMKDNLIFLN